MRGIEPGHPAAVREEWGSSPLPVLLDRSEAMRVSASRIPAGLGLIGRVAPIKDIKPSDVAGPLFRR